MVILSGQPSIAAVDELLDGFHRRAETVESGSETEPGVEAEHAPVALNGLHDLLPFGDGARHGLLAPDVLAGLRSGDGDEAMPVRRRGNVHNVDVVALENFAKILVALDALAAHFERPLEVIGVYVAHGHETRSGVGQVPLPHSADSDNGLGQFFAGRGEPQPAQQHDAAQC